MSEVLFVKIVYVKTSVSDSDNVDVIFDKLFFSIFMITYIWIIGIKSCRQLVCISGVLCDIRI